MSNKELKDRLISIAIKELIANRWNNLDMKKLSSLSKSPLDDVLLVCSSKHKLLDYWSDNINFEMVKSLSESIVDEDDDNEEEYNEILLEESDDDTPTYH